MIHIGACCKQVVIISGIKNHDYVKDWKKFSYESFTISQISFSYIHSETFLFPLIFMLFLSIIQLKFKIYYRMNYKIMQKYNTDT